MSRTSATPPWLGLLIAIALAGCETADAPTSLEPGRQYDHTTDHVVVTNTNNDGPGSLREAAFFAMNGTLITFAPELWGQAIVLASPIVPAAATFSIEGPTAQGIAISGGGTSAVFSIDPGSDVTLKNLTLRDAPGSVAGAILVTGGAVSVVNSAITNNATAGIHQVDGGATVENSTISNNVLGIHVSGGDRLELRHATIASNNEGLEHNGNVRIAATIIADNNLDCDPAPSSPPMDASRSNIDSDGTCGLDPDLDFPNTDPLLGPLADNGGPTRTHALGFGSPALDRIICVLATDQRGVTRPQGSLCDIGAYERIPISVQLTVDSRGSVNPNNGAATVTGALTCSSELQVELLVTVTQLQMFRRVPVPIQSELTITVPCNGTGSWTATVPPPAGNAFVNGTATVEVSAENSDNAGQATAEVRLFWGKK